jgi:ABC-type uncharacterized transport system fused permease/ATPase subunit
MLISWKPMKWAAKTGEPSKKIIGIDLVGMGSLITLMVFNGWTLGAINSAGGSLMHMAWIYFYTLGLPALVLLTMTAGITAYLSYKLQLRIQNKEFNHFMDKLNGMKNLALIQKIMARQGYDNPWERLQNETMEFARLLVETPVSMAQQAVRVLALIGAIFAYANFGLAAAGAIIGFCALAAILTSGTAWLMTNYYKVKERKQLDQALRATMRQTIASQFRFASHLTRHGQMLDPTIFRLQQAIIANQDKLNANAAGVTFPRTVSEGTASFAAPFPLILYLVNAYKMGPQLYNDSSWPAAMLMDALNLAKYVNNWKELKSFFQRSILDLETTFKLAEAEAAKPLGVTASIAADGSLAFTGIDIPVPFAAEDRKLVTGSDIAIPSGQMVAVSGDDSLAVITFLDKLNIAVRESLPERQGSTLFLDNDPPFPEAQTGYSLREIMAYLSHEPEKIDRELFGSALEKVNLQKFAVRLDEKTDENGIPWMERFNITGDEKKALGLARIFLTDPKDPPKLLIMTDIPEKDRATILTNIKAHLPDTVSRPISASLNGARLPVHKTKPPFKTRPVK